MKLFIKKMRLNSRKLLKQADFLMKIYENKSQMNLTTELNFKLNFAYNAD